MGQLTAAVVRTIDVPILAVIGEADFARPAVDALVDVKPDVEVSVLAGKNHATSVVRCRAGAGGPGVPSQAALKAVKTTLTSVN